MAQLSGPPAKKGESKKGSVEDKYGLMSNTNDVSELDPNDPLVKMLDGMLKAEEESKKPTQEKVETKQDNLLLKIQTLNSDQTKLAAGNAQLLESLNES